MSGYLESGPGEGQWEDAEVLKLEASLDGLGCGRWPSPHPQLHCANSLDCDVGETKLHVAKRLMWGHDLG